MLQIAVVNLEVLQEFFSTTTMTWAQWLAAAAVGSTVLWVEELRKAIVRHRQRTGAQPWHGRPRTSHSPRRNAA